MAILDTLVPEEVKNVGGRDRTARAVVGALLVAVGVGLFANQRGSYAGVAVLAGAGLLVNAATQFCGLNALLGVDTCSRDD
jgi:uncharacterized membrane-anchored protein YitT (DUF2179 family)